MMVKYELKKVFIKRQNLILLILAGVTAVVLSIFAITSIYYVEQDGTNITGLRASRTLVEEKNRWQGELTGEILSEIVADIQEREQQYPDGVPDEVYAGNSQSYQDIEAMIIKILSGSDDYDFMTILNITPDQAKELYTIRDENIEEIAEQYGATAEQQLFLREVLQKSDSPFYYEASADYNDTITTTATTYGLILVVLIGFFAAGIFSDESVFRADSVFFSSKYGRSKAITSKILSSMIMTTAVYWIGMGLLSLICFGVMGTDGFSTPYQVDNPYSIYNITMGQRYLLILLCGYIASLLSAALSMFISAKTHSANIAVCVPFLLFCVSPFIGRALPFDTFFLLTPDNLTNVLNGMKAFNIFQIGGLVFRQIPFLILFYSVLSVLLLPLIHRSYRRYSMA